MQATRRQLLKLMAGALVGAAVVPTLVPAGPRKVSAQAIAGAQTFTGNASTTALGPFPLNAGLAVVRAQFNGTANFSANLILPQPGTKPTDMAPALNSFFPLFNQAGVFKEAAVAVIGTPGDYYYQIASSAAFQLSIEQPLPETVSPVQQASFSGKGQDATPYFMLPATVSQISMQTTSRQMVGSLYHLDDLGGEAIVAGVASSNGALFDFRDPSNQSTFPLALADGGPYIFAATNDVTGQNTWTVSFS